VYAFEPLKDYAEFIQHNLANQPRLHAFPAGLGDENANVTFYRDHHNLGWNTMIAKQAGSSMEKVTVEIMKFDDWAAQHNINSCFFAKIDVEGAEYKVLRGMKKFLQQLVEYKPYLLIEIGWGTDHPNWDEEKAELEWLWKEGGYEVTDLPTRGGTVDRLFVPKKRRT
jgi:FkbM family methyltransferase